MTEVLKMYNLRPIIEQNMIESVSQCVYPMKNIHEKIDNHVDTNITDQNNLELPEMAALEDRQKIILQQCEKLKAHMQQILKELKICSKPAQPKSAKSSKPVDITNLEDLSIKVNASKIPYFLPLLKKSIENSINLNIKFYIQSKIADPAEAQKFSQCLQSSVIENLPTINISVIWAQGEDTELVVSPTQIPITGETNILRFFARLQPDSLPYVLETPSVRAQIDQVLLLCEELSDAETKTQRLGCFRDFNALLDKSNWIAGTDQQTIADLAAYSVVKQLNLSRELSVKMSKWYQRLDV